MTRTVYAGAQAMRRQWPSARLVTLEGARQHDVYGVYGNACVDITRKSSNSAPSCVEII